MKQKITFALVLLFGLLLLLGTLGMMRIQALADDAREILKDNYISLEYVQRMLGALDEMPADSASWVVFAENLQKQRDNITETGEQEATDRLDQHFRRLKSEPADSGAYRGIRQSLVTLATINLEAIARKNDRTDQTAERSIALLGIISTLCILIGFTFLINFPGYVANPIREFTAGIREIARGNYEQRIRLDRKDEFGELAGAFNEMAARLYEYEHSNLARLLFEKRRLETIIGALNDPVIGLDENRHILFANPAALGLLNLPAAKLLGKDAREIALGNDLMRALMQRTAPGQTPEPLKIFADGKESFFQPERFDISLPDASAESAVRLAGQVLFLKNITAFRERDLAKTNFIATISHELKTPISALKMGLGLLDDPRIGNLNAEQRQLLQQLAADADRLLSITAELLKHAQAETGNIQLNLAPHDPAAIVDLAWEALSVPAAEKGIELNRHILTDAQVLADADKAAWVLINLLSNAIRHSPARMPVELDITADDTSLRFTVRDRGAGIPASLHEKIFERYFRAPDAPGGGSGLGLAISREFILAMGGTIGVDSQPGAGSAFWFTLRRAGRG